MNKVTTQKQAVYSAVKRYAKRNTLSGAAKFKIYEQLEKDFLAGRIELKPTAENLIKLADEKALRSYIIGLTSNWLRKDERLSKKKAA